MLIKFDIQIHLTIVIITDPIVIRAKISWIKSMTSYELPMIRMTSSTGLSIWRSCSIIATRSYVVMTTCICIRTAFLYSPKRI